MLDVKIRFKYFFFFFFSDLDIEVLGVWNINILCNVGSIEWISFYGVLCVELSYMIGGLYEVCFKI